MEYVSTCKTALNSAGSCLLYGAGNIGQEMVEVLQKCKIKPAAFIDSKRTGFLAGLPIFHPEKIPDELKVFPVIISIFSYPSSSSLRSITQLLENSGMKFIISFETFYGLYMDFFNKTHYWLHKPDFYRQHSKELSAVYDLLADDFSKNLLQKQIAFRLSGNVADIPPVSEPNQQYFDSTVCSRKEFREFWDVGAFTGDTLKNAAEHSVHFRKVVAFEPDIGNFICYCKYLKKHHDEYESAIALPLAVGRCNEILHFAETAFSNAAVSNTGNTLVPSVSLDSVFIGATPDFIKMDIEGSELSALKGMQNIIVKNQPLLAISVYHRPEDIFEIPLYQKNILNDYKYYIRCYGEHCFESVLYAVPDHIY